MDENLHKKLTINIMNDICIINNLKHKPCFNIINIWNGNPNRYPYLLAQRVGQGMKDLSLSICHVDCLSMTFSIAPQEQTASDHPEGMVKGTKDEMNVKYVAELCDLDMSTDLMDFGVGQDEHVSEQMGGYPAEIDG